MLPLRRNQGMPFELDAVLANEVDDGAVERRVDALAAAPRLEARVEIARLLLAIRSLDLTTLAADDTEDRVRALCARAMHPIAADLVDALHVTASSLHVAAVCVDRRFTRTAVQALAGSGIPVAAVAGGFPQGYTGHEERVRDVRSAAAEGAAEIDVVITRALAQDGRWHALYDEIHSLRSACGPSTLKVILATGDLGDLTSVARSSHVAIMAGADFLKTSTGRERVNATLSAGLVMARAIRQHWERGGNGVGLKPAGGVRTADAALAWLQLVEGELGSEWLVPQRFRIGASGIVANIEARLRALIKCGD